MTTRTGSGSRRHYATTAHLVDMLDALFQAFRKRSPMALPEFVLHAESDTGDADVADEDVEGILAELRQELRSRGVPFAAVRQSSEDSGLSPRARALHIVQALGGKPSPNGREPYIEANPWRGGGRQYGRYTFPRSDLLSSIEDVVGELGRDADPEALLGGLNNRSWRPGGTQWATRLRDAATDASKTVPALLIAVVAVLITDKPWYITLAFLAAVLVALFVLSVLPGRAPIFLGLRREIRWFLGTTYLNQTPRAERGEGLTWRLLRLWPPGSVRQRVAAVARDIQDGGLLDDGRPGTGDEDAQLRHLQLRVHALREDLRDAHLAWSLDLRGRKRPTPPVLVLPQTGVDNGRIELIKAISDIRSIRSELDPLLVIAAVRRADVEHLQRSVTAHRSASLLPGTATDLPAWYADWNRSRRVSQSPSLSGSTLPWVLRVPLPDAWLNQPDLGVSSVRRSHLSIGRPRWTWFWSLPALALVLAASGLGLGVRDHRLRTDYCESSLRGANHDSRRVAVPEGTGTGTECVGVATGNVTFPVGQDVQALIKKQNAAIEGGNYVTIVYAGPLSGTAGTLGGKQLVKGVEELRGAYLVQRANNEEQPVKLRILVANGGTDMNSQSVMADRIVDLARRDRTIVGVVGLGRDMSDSKPVLEKLRKAELPVVSGTNSGTYLLDLPNFFSLAATDQWQARQLGLLAQQLKGRPGTNSAVVLARDPGASHDRYTTEQKTYGHEMLQDVGYRVRDLDNYTLRGGGPVLDQQIQDICARGNVPRVIYFAGRSEDVTTLMDGITSNPGCDGKRIAVLAGDDLSQAGFETERSSVAANVTLYHFILTAPRHETEGSLFLDRLRKISDSKGLGLDHTTSETSKSLSDGQTMLTHDATEVLYRAAKRDGEPRGRAEAWAGLLRTNVAGLATGRIDFRNTSDEDRQGLDAGTRDNYVISLMKVANPGTGHYERTLLCSRRAGDSRPLTQQECDIDKGTHVPGA